MMRQTLSKAIAGLIILGLTIPPFVQASPRPSPDAETAPAPTAHQPPPPPTEETMAVPKNVLEAWEDLPPDIQAKVDPRLLAEFRGEVVPTHRGL